MQSWSISNTIIAWPHWVLVTRVVATFFVQCGHHDDLGRDAMTEQGLWEKQLSWAVEKLGATLSRGSELGTHQYMVISAKLVESVPADCIFCSFATQDCNSFSTELWRAFLFYLLIGPACCSSRDYEVWHFGELRIGSTANWYDAWWRCVGCWMWI